MLPKQNLASLRGFLFQLPKATAKAAIMQAWSCTPALSQALQN